MSEKPPLSSNWPPSQPHDVAFCGSVACTMQLESEDDLDYPVPYSEAKAQQWAAEDPLFCKETYKQDSYFDKDNQAELRRRMEDVRSGRVKTIPWEAVRQKANAIQD